MTALLAVDLDRTLIYSRAAATAWGAPAELVAVERHRAADASWMTAGAAATFARLRRRAQVVPVTTRTPAQYVRVRLPGRPPEYAVAANGGVLLVDGHADRQWDRTVAAVLAGAAPLTEVWDHAARVCRPEWTAKLRNAGGLFCYAVLDRVPPGFVAEAAAWAAARGWQVSLQGRKLYWVPRALTKSAAVAEVARRTGSSAVFAAGDSILDADLLNNAQRGIVARHGELVASGWRARHVTVTAACGLRAGAEIVDWLATQVRLR